MISVFVFQHKQMPGHNLPMCRPRLTTSWLRHSVCVPLVLLLALLLVLLLLLILTVFNPRPSCLILLLLVLVAGLWTNNDYYVC